MLRLKRTLSTAVLAAAVAWATPATADTILFNPDGTGDVGAIAVDSMDQAVGNAMAEDVTIFSTAGTSFTLLYQANLAQMFEAGDPNAVFTQGDGGNYFTFVASFGETIDVVVGTTLIFGFDPTSTDNFFEMYATNASGDNLEGTGFNDGTLILSGHAVAEGFISTFTFQDFVTTVPLDGHGDDDYPGTLTLIGSGVANIRIAIDFVDPNYFPEIAPDTFISFAITNTTLAMPFLTVDPSACFHATDVLGCLGGTAGVSSVGAINAVSGSNTMMQADASTSFLTATRDVPEPGLLALLGLGLLGAATRLRTRRA